MKSLREQGNAPLFIVMMAAAFSFLIAYALTKLTSAMGLLAKSSQLEADLETMVREINGTLADSKACPQAFRTALDAKVVANPVTVGGAGGVTVNRLYSSWTAGAGGRRIATLNGTTAGLVVTQMDLESPYRLYGTAATGGTWEMTLAMKLEKILDPTTTPVTYMPGSSVILKKFRMSVSLDNANGILTCSPIGSRNALGPMSPLRSAQVPVTTATCAVDSEKDTACGDLTPLARAGLPPTPQQYFAASQGDVLAYGMLLAQGTPGPPGSTVPTGFGLYGVSGILFGLGGPSSWTLYGLGSSAGSPCIPLCIHKDAPIRFTRNTIAANAALSGVAPSKDALCKSDIGPQYIAATFNDFMQSGWSSSGAAPGGATVASYSATIGGHDGEVQFSSHGVGETLVMYYTANAGNFPVACVRRSQ
jgi:hypothetical protein